MASWQAYTMSFALRHTFKRRLARARGALEARAVMNHSIFKVPRDVLIRPASLGGVPGEWVGPASGTPAGLLVYLHGGGYFACSTRTHRPFTTAFAQRGFRVYAPDYRLGPEHRFPAAVEDAAAVWRAVAAEAGAVPMCIGGDSAGGGLALATMLKLREDGSSLPSAAALFSPLTDLVGIGASRQVNSRRCAMFYGAGLGRVTEFYITAGGDPRHPLASPLYADLRGLPPLLIHVGADETLRDDSTEFALRARAAGVAVELKVWPAVPHVWQLFYRFVPEGRQSLASAAKFLHEAMRRNAPTAALEAGAR